MTSRTDRKNLKVLLLLGGILAASSSLAIFAVPLYRVFCQVTGYGGTTQIAEQGEVEPAVLDREITVRFAANTNRDLPWRFRPIQTTQKVRVGETALAFYESENLTDVAVTGVATFNVTPHKAGLYFSKVDCFCFTEQTLEPGQRVDMPVTYFIDPEIAEDDNLDEVTEITLSYTFFRQGQPQEKVASRD